MPVDQTMNGVSHPRRPARRACLPRDAARRRFLGRSLSWLAGAQALPAAATQARETPRAGAVSFIDAHVHLNDPAMQLSLMQAHGAAQAIVFWGGRSDNSSVVEAARRYPGRFIPFASISPERRAYRGAWERDDTALLDDLDRLLASGDYRGIGEISSVHFPSPGFPESDFSPAGAVTRGLLALARRHRLPVLLHVELTRLAELSALLAQFEDVPVLWAHGGYTPLFIARRMLQRHPNLTYELSARTWPRHPRSPEYTLLQDGERVWPEWLALIESQAARFVVGSDAANRSLDSDTMKYASVQNLLRQLGPEAQARVARDNLRALLHLDAPGSPAPAPWTRVPDQPPRPPEPTR
jgi:predicted TIM-barrel fold metal-dependent hydrolase